MGASRGGGGGEPAGPQGGCGQCGLCVAGSRKTEWEAGGGGRRGGKSLLESDCSPRVAAHGLFRAGAAAVSQPPPPRVWVSLTSPRTIVGGSVGRARGLSLTLTLLPLSASLARAALSAVREEEGEGEGPLCGESGGGGGQSGKVSLGEGRVKGPLPDGLLTLWCPASPIPAYTLSGREDRPAFPLHPNPSPCPWSPGRSGERKLPQLGSPAAEARGDPISRPQAQLWKLRPPFWA